MSITQYLDGLKTLVCGDGDCYEKWYDFIFPGPDFKIIFQVLPFSKRVSG